MQPKIFDSNWRCLELAVPEVLPNNQYVLWSLNFIYFISKLTQSKFISVSVIPLSDSVTDDPKKCWGLRSNVLEAPRYT